jgi:FMN phosphatase YigB (HAD superfamily)
LRWRELQSGGTVVLSMKFVLFDLDDTLTDRQASLERYVAALLADFAEELGAC